MGEVTREEFVALQEQVKTHGSEINELKTGQGNLFVQQGITLTKIDNLTEMFKKMEIKIDKLMEKPAKRWDAVVNTLIVAVVTAVGSSVMTALFIRKIGG